ncbi:acetyl esterase [Novosphingobium sp. 1529]|uniref:alpha/beta hydrolase n=1 Tax=Novosphingobium sp. 1529 TaxID=3156424 RepID=UPI00145A244A
MSLEIPALDPDIAYHATRFDEVMGKPGLTTAQFRELYCQLLADQGEPLARAVTTDLAIPTRHGEMAARLYSPATAAAVPLVLYMHGGGFMVGDLDCLDKIMHEFSLGTEMAFLSLDYALAPEHTYPVALEQCEDALVWALKNVDALGVCARVAFAGDSAGGNLAALMAQRHHALLGDTLFWQGLINPVLDFPGVTAAQKLSHRQFGAGPILNIDVMKSFNQAYFPDEEAMIAASPLRFSDDMSGLPPAFIAAAQCDPLRDDSAEYAALLRSAGVLVTHKVYPGMCHNFMTLAHRSKVAAGMLDDFVRFAKLERTKALAKSAAPASR